MSSPENRDGTGKFKQGQSGNPGGRPKNPLAALIREKTKDGEKIVEVAFKLLSSKKESSRQWACEFLRDTGWHKPIQGIKSVDGEGNDVLPAIQFVPVVPSNTPSGGNQGL